MPQMRLMVADSTQAQATTDAVVRALRASPELVVGDVSAPVANRDRSGRGGERGCRVYIEVLVTGAAAAGGEYAVDVEVVDTRPARRARGGARRALPG